MGHFDKIEQRNEEIFTAYWKKHGVDVKTRIEETFSKKGSFPSLRSDLVMKVPKIFDLNIRVVGKGAEIMPRQQRKFLLPEQR